MAKTKYVPTEYALANPSHQFLDGVLVGIGAKVTIQRTAPKSTLVAPECTQEQYEKLYKAGYTHLIKEVQE